MAQGNTPIPLNPKNQIMQVIRESSGLLLCPSLVERYVPSLSFVEYVKVLYQK